MRKSLPARTSSPTRYFVPYFRDHSISFATIFLVSAKHCFCRYAENCIIFHSLPSTHFRNLLFQASRTDRESHRLGGGRAHAPHAPPGGASPKAVGRDHRARRKVGRALRASRPPPYCTTTTTLKNRIAAFSGAVAPSTDFLSSFSTSTTRLRGVFSVLHTKAPP